MHEVLGSPVPPLNKQKQTNLTAPPKQTKTLRIKRTSLLVKKLLTEPTSVDTEAWLATTMAHDFMGGEGAIKGAQHIPWSTFPRADPTCFSPSPPKSRGCETPQTLKKVKRRQKSQERAKTSAGKSECWSIIFKTQCNSNRKTFLP